MTNGGKMFSPKQKASHLVPPASEQILALKTDIPNTHTCLDNTSPILLNKPNIHRYSTFSKRMILHSIYPRDPNSV